MDYYAEFAYNTSNTIPGANSVYRYMAKLAYFKDNEDVADKIDDLMLDRSIRQTVYGAYKKITVFFPPKLIQDTKTLTSDPMGNYVGAATFFPLFLKAKYIWIASGYGAAGGSLKQVDGAKPGNFFDSTATRYLVKARRESEKADLDVENLLKNGLTFLSEKLF